MSSKTNSPIQPDEIFQSAVSLWSYLKNNSGLDSFFYDKDLLEGNNTEKGLYSHLNIQKLNIDFEQDLKHYSIPVEQLLIAFFKTLQPFAQMMSDICVFFERHLITGTNQSLIINFDFTKAKNTGLEFKLEHFRQTLEKLTRVKQLVNYYQLNSNEFWPLIRLFSPDYLVVSQNKSVRSWIDKYKKVGYEDRQDSVFNAHDIEIPSTGNVFLNQQLNKVISIWKSFVNTCRNINPRRVVFKATLGMYINSKDYKSADEITAPWLAKDLFYAESDYWPATLLDCMFFKLEELANLNGTKKNEAEETLAIEIDRFLNNLSSGKREEELLLNELIDLLKIPVWKKRYELYAAWILKLIDDVFEDYPHEIHHQDGKLTLSFSATHLASIATSNGSLQLWSEVRSPVEGTELKKLEGKSRTNNIQPDYAIYKDNSTDTKDCIAAIEVKQYRKHSTANFKAALNDYTRGLPKANVILVNYGSVSETMTLTSADRSHFFGQIKPKSPEIDSFKIEVQKYFPKLPLPKIFSINDQILLFSLPIDHLYVDISSSLDQIEYKVFVEKIVTAIIDIGKVKRLIAGGTGNVAEWMDPDVYSVKELVALSFNHTTEFAELIPDNGHVVVITDDDGIKSIEIARKSAYIIKYNSESDQEIIILEDGLIMKI